MASRRPTTYYPYRRDKVDRPVSRGRPADRAEPDARTGARADYAVRAMLAIAAAERARAAGEQRAATATELAAAQAIPHSLLRAILTELRSAGLLRSHHGTDGGFSLAYPASEITVGAVLRAVAGPLVTVSGLPADRVVYHGVAAGLTDVWRAVNAAIEAVVDRTSLADLLAASQPPAGPRRPR